MNKHLARILVRNISKDYKAFVSFVKNANYDDLGEVAAQRYLGLSLAQIEGSFLG